MLPLRACGTPPAPSAVRLVAAQPSYRFMRHRHEGHALACVAGGGAVVLVYLPYLGLGWTPCVSSLCISSTWFFRP